MHGPHIHIGTTQRIPDTHRKEGQDSTHTLAPHNRNIRYSEQMEEIPHKQHQHHYNGNTVDHVESQDKDTVTVDHVESQDKYTINTVDHRSRRITGQDRHGNHKLAGQVFENLVDLAIRRKHGDVTALEHSRTGQRLHTFLAIFLSFLHVHKHLHIMARCNATSKKGGNTSCIHLGF